MVAAGLSVVSVVRTASEPTEKTITSPSVILVISAPSRYPSSSRFGFGRSIINVDAATSVGFNAAASARRNTLVRSGG